MTGGQALAADGATNGTDKAFDFASPENQQHTGPAARYVAVLWRAVFRTLPQ